MKFIKSTQLLLALLAGVILNGCDSGYSGNEINYAPIALSNEINTVTDTPIVGMLEASDQNNDTLSYQLVTEPTNGSVDVSSNGDFTYTPSAEFTGTDSFTFTANDGSFNSNQATITINVEVKSELISQYVRRAFNKNENDMAEGVNGRSFTDDTTSVSEFQDLIDNGEQ